jgi:hypothetical protein
LQKVDIYRNLHKPGYFSIKDRSTGRVFMHRTCFFIRDVKFVVQPGGLRRARLTGQRNVHAFVRGNIPINLILLCIKSPRSLFIVLTTLLAVRTECGC